MSKNGYSILPLVLGVLLFFIIGLICLGGFISISQPFSTRVYNDHSYIVYKDSMVHAPDCTCERLVTE